MSWWRKRWVQTTGLVLATGAAAYAMIFVDVQARAREAFRQGAQYAQWHKDPEGKRRFLEQKFLKEKKELDARRDKGRVTAEEYAHELDILSFDRDQASAESAVKYAYQWYKDTYELFSPPESKWVRRARFLAPAAKQQWREELRAKNIPFEEYMLDLEAGEEEGALMVTSTRDRAKAHACVDALAARGIQAKIFDAVADGRLPQEGLKVLVPREKFWDAHEALKPLVEPPLAVEGEHR